MGANGIDWQGQLYGARSEMFPITLIYGDNFLDGNVYNEMAMFGLVADEAIVNA